MGLFKSKSLDEEIQEHLEQEISDLGWLDKHLRSFDNDKLWKESLSQIDDRIKDAEKLLKKLKG